LQQTPSTQKPLLQALSLEQLWPGSFLGAQLVPSQYAPDAHCVSPLQLVAQTEPSAQA
jgi:hypothetical protein